MSERTAQRRVRFEQLLATGVLGVVGVVALTGCGNDEPEVVAPGLFDVLPPADDDPAPSLVELAARSDRVVLGAFVDVEEGWRFGDGPDDPDAKRMVEVIVESGEMDGPIHLNWPYPMGYEIDDIRDAMPIASRVVLYLVDFRSIAEEPGWYHLGPDDDHTHWVLTTRQGIIMFDPETGELILGDPDRPFADAPAVGSDLEAWVVGGAALNG